MAKSTKVKAGDSAQVRRLRASLAREKEKSATLAKERAEAREQQAAAAEILKVISRSPSDAQPVFDAIVKRARRLLRGHSAAVTRLAGDALHLAAYTATSRSGDAALRRHRAGTDWKQTATGRAIRTRAPYVVPDTEKDARPQARKMGRTRGYRSMLIVPLLRGDVVLGALNVTRKEPGPFSRHDIGLLQSFAEHAVIAIENVRRFNETNEVLERQTATGEILKVIASSPTDVQPVFDAIARSALKLLGGFSAAVTRIADGAIHLASFTTIGGAGDEALRRIFPQSVALSPGAHGRAARTGLPAVITDALAQDAPSELREVANARGFRSMIAVPMIRERTVIGTISVPRREPGGFSAEEIALLQTFADQAVIAIENVRLFNETKEALERQTATAEILRVIAGSPSNVKPVFDAILEGATRLCDAHLGVLNLYDGSSYRTVAVHGGKPEFKEWAFGRGTFMLSVHDRLVTERTPWQEADMRESESFRAGSANRVQFAELSGARSLLLVPLLKEKQVLGNLAIYRPEVRPFTQKQIDLVATFADQAVIAIENVRLFNETKEALERQTATAEILKVIASSPSDVQPVFETVARNAMTLCGGVYANVFRFDGELLHLVARAGKKAGPTLARKYPMRPDASQLSGRVVLGGSVLCIEDTRTDAQYDREIAAAFDLARRMVGTPMLREGKAIGAIVVGWAEPGKVPQVQQDLLKTFADQAVIAIENVRLFNETKEALERQTATAEILKVISRSPTDTQPVFDAIANSCLRLFSGMRVSLVLRRGDVIDRAASAGMPEEESTEALWPLPLDDQVISGRAILRGALVHVPDVQSESWIGARSREAAARAGHRSIMSAPMMREGSAIGAIHIMRAHTGLFDEKQIALLRTFADQAVIAIENVRLFKELQARTEQLTKSVGQLTALGEVGQAISSTLDLEVVLKTIVSRAVQLTALDAGAIYEYDEHAEEFQLRAAERVDDEYLEVLRRTRIRKGEGAVGRAALTSEPTQIRDVQSASYQTRLREAIIRAGYRAVLVVPLRREEHVIGALSVSRKTPGSFADEVVELLKTFATQSAMAIQNARLFREIAEKGKQLEIASQHKSQFLASMSHELRTPLNAILGFNEMILGDVYGPLPADIQPPLAQMQTSGKHLLRLINNVLDLAKIEAGRMELALSDYSVQDTVEAVRSTLRPLAAEKGIEFLANVPADIPLAHGDPGRITQCLMNLAGNSLKFTKVGKVEISVAENGQRLLYRVADTGVGIPPDKIDSLFTEFRQTDATIASEYGGTGLGLSISKKFVEMHGGRIWVESTPGRGSTFSFEIPLRAGEGKQA